MPTSKSPLSQTHSQVDQDLTNSHLEEAFATLVAEVGSLVVVLFPNFDKHEVFFLYFFVFLFCFLLRSPVKDRGISVCEFSSAIFTLVDLSHPMAERLLFEPKFF